MNQNTNSILQVYQKTVCAPLADREWIIFYPWCAIYYSRAGQSTPKRIPIFRHFVAVCVRYHAFLIAHQQFQERPSLHTDTVRDDGMECVKVSARKILSQLAKLTVLTTATSVAYDIAIITADVIATCGAFDIAPSFLRLPRPVSHSSTCHGDNFSPHRKLGTAHTEKRIRFIQHRLGNC